MLDKLRFIKEKYCTLSHELTKPEVIEDNKLYTKTIKEYNELEPIVNAYDRYLAKHPEWNDD